jgi:hypothetical protein
VDKYLIQNRIFHKGLKDVHVSLAKDSKEFHN